MYREAYTIVYPGLNNSRPTSLTIHPYVDQGMTTIGPAVLRGHVLAQFQLQMTIVLDN